jgi:hypothetical protein
MKTDKEGEQRWRKVEVICNTWGNDVIVTQENIIENTRIAYIGEEVM